MTIVEMLEQSGVLTLLGMGIVFLFLVILIICVTLMGKIIHALGADKSDQGSAVTRSPRPAVLPANQAAKTGAVTAAITAAVHEYRQNN
ncbi:MAG: OadG family protein [Treponema sp.]|nr:OadG family protein [Treponema sp.]